MWLNDSLRQVTRSFAVILCGLAAAAASSVDNNEALVKLSRNGICHERADPSYNSTTHYQAFNTLAECVQAGGRPLHLGKANPRSDATVGRNAHSTAEKTQPFKLKLMALAVSFGIGLVLIVGFGPALRFFLLHRARRLGRRGAADRVSKPKHTLRTRAIWASGDERDLITACLGDRDAAERLIQYEIDRNSSLSWGAAAAAALARLKRDNH